jgi:hypothetical protein
MAQKLYKWTGTLTQPDAYDSSFAAPQWYGTDSDGVGYAFLDTEFAKLIKSSNDDVAATTASAAKTFVLTNSRQAKFINKECVKAIRKKYSIDDELQANRTASSTEGKAVLDDIASIVAAHQTRKNALVGD